MKIKSQSVRITIAFAGHFHGSAVQSSWPSISSFQILELNFSTWGKIRKLKQYVARLQKIFGINFPHVLSFTLNVEFSTLLERKYHGKIIYVGLSSVKHLSNCLYISTENKRQKWNCKNYLSVVWHVMYISATHQLELYSLQNMLDLVPSCRIDFVKYEWSSILVEYLRFDELGNCLRKKSL